MGWLNNIFQVWWDKGFVQGEKNTGGNGRKGSFQVKQHPTGFIGSTDDNIFSLSLVFKTIPRSLVVEAVGRAWVLGELWDARV